MTFIMSKMGAYSQGTLLLGQKNQRSVTKRHHRELESICFQATLA